MTRRELLGMTAAGAVLVLAGPAARGATPAVRVLKSPYCGCCGAWVDHMRAAGFTMEVEDVEQERLDEAKAAAGVTPRTASCHTAFLDGYVLEGHVPAEDAKRLLEERPAALGLATPGMPVGSPGMEMSGASEPFEVLLIQADGSLQVFARH